MSSIICCDVCGVELKKGKGVYRAKIEGASGMPYRRDYYHDAYELCLKCAKPLLQWKREHPKK